nr:hypothetical protein [uncultured Halomonas sp.]
MARLDTRGLASGFTQGFGLMDRYYNRQNQNKRADERLEMARENERFRRFNANEDRDFREEQFDYRQESDAATRDLQERQFEQSEKQADRSYALARGRLGLQQSRINYQRQQDAKAEQLQQDLQLIESGYATLTEGGELSDEHLAAFERNPAYDPRHVASDEMSNAIMIGEQVVDPTSPADINSPEAIDALNTMFGPRINRGEGGTKRIVAAVPGPDGESLAFEVEVTREDGSTYRAPMTQGRGTEKDAEVLQVPMDRLIEQFAGYRTLNRVAQTEQFRRGVQRYGQRMGVSAAGGMQARMGEREKMYLKGLQSELEAIQKRAAEGIEPLSDDDKMRMSEIRSELESRLNPGAGYSGAAPGGDDDLGNAVLKALGGKPASDQRLARGLQGAPGSARDRIAQQEQQEGQQQAVQEQQREVTSTLEEADRVIDRLSRQRAGDATPGGLMAGINEARGLTGQADPETLQQGRQVVQRLMRLHDAPDATEWQRKWALDAINQLRDNGVTLPQQP